MGNADKVPDASMEDILASIRKIISESGEEGEEVSKLNEEVLELSDDVKTDVASEEVEAADAEKPDIADDAGEEASDEAGEEVSIASDASKDDSEVSVASDENSDDDKDISPDDLESLFDEGGEDTDSTDVDISSAIETLDQNALDDVFNGADEKDDENKADDTAEVEVETDFDVNDAENPEGDLTESSDASEIEELDPLDIAGDEVSSGDAIDNIEAEAETELEPSEAIAEVAEEMKTKDIISEAMELTRQAPNNSNLVSNEIKRGVNDAFDNLENTFLTTSKEIKSLDQLVQDMLRPMLKQWLDDNLEEIVKRMVQKEINRITQK